jgi:hypothetical protein
MDATERFAEVLASLSEGDARTIDRLICDYLLRLGDDSHHGMGSVRRERGRLAAAFLERAPHTELRDFILGKIHNAPFTQHSV